MRQLTADGRHVMSSGTMLMLFAASAALLAIFIYSPTPGVKSSPVAVIAAVGLTDDSGGESLFRNTGLVPGKPVSRCLRVSYVGPPGGTVYFSAVDVTGPLAAHLKIKVEQGSGGDSASCAGFTSSSTVFDGMLPDLTDPDPSVPRTSTGWSASTGDTRTYRITAAMPDSSAVQGRRSTATFRWFIFGVPDPDPVVGIADESTPAPPSPSGVPPSAAAAVDRAANPAVVVPIPRGTPDTAQSDRVAAEEKPIATKLREALAKLGQDITEVAVRTSSHGALPVAGFAVLLAFLGLQNRIDRLDPKLALAPMKDPHLVFIDAERYYAGELATTPAAPHEEDA